MKKVLIGLAIAIAAASSQASYLFWQVTGDEGWWRGGTLGEGLAAAGTQENPVYITEIRVRDSNGGVYSSYDISDDSQATPTAFFTGNVYAGGIVDSSYTYYIEIMGYGGAYGGNSGSTVRLAESTHRTYAELSGSITTDLSSIGNITAWTGEAYAAPEPTSGLLLLVGASLLALKRRKV